MSDSDSDPEDARRERIELLQAELEAATDSAKLTLRKAAPITKRKKRPPAARAAEPKRPARRSKRLAGAKPDNLYLVSDTAPPVQMPVTMNHESKPHVSTTTRAAVRRPSSLAVGVDLDGLLDGVEESISTNDDCSSYNSSRTLLVCKKLVRAQVYSVAVKGSSLFACGDKIGHVALAKREENVIVEKSISEAHSSTVSNLEFRSSKDLWTFSYDGHVKRVDLNRGGQAEFLLERDVSKGWESVDAAFMQYGTYVERSSCAFGNCVVMCDSFGYVHVTDVRTKPSATRRGKVHDRKVQQVDFFENFMCSSSLDRSVKFFDVRKLSFSNDKAYKNDLSPVDCLSFYSDTNSVSSVQFSPNGKYACTIGFSHAIKSFYEPCAREGEIPGPSAWRSNRADTGRYLATFRLTFDPKTESTLVCGSKDFPRRFGVFSLEPKKIVKSADLIDDALGTICSRFAISSTHDVIAGGNNSGSLFVFV